MASGVEFTPDHPVEMEYWYRSNHTGDRTVFRTVQADQEGRFEDTVPDFQTLGTGGYFAHVWATDFTEVRIDHQISGQL
ncbi:hypothetical protein [Streptomyces griseomycini]|uniref:Uncharacterized protein n=1 Tax=Streptomyces griseomycini TaxID=66895 RepID=A0A7W7PYP2_9ACTN|nr:hypothetical protein [Streptomyces griseomycini]MBB4903757.1 hypothetical protein [Streptomyces griseomycini]GGR63559.1 hypothetical protein GCM10015536_78400 [Streptomyces griseomycini]